jgi:hypothetical protein
MDAYGAQWTSKLLHRGISRRPQLTVPRDKRGGKRVGANARGAGYEPGPQGTAPGSAQRDRHRKTPLDEPGCLYDYHPRK